MNDTIETGLSALRIDPQHRTVEVFHLKPDEVKGLLHGEHTAIFDLDETHCLVIDLNAEAEAQPARFRLTTLKDRPFFGQALVLSVGGDIWASAQLDLKALVNTIIWEVWDPAQERYINAATPA